MAAKIKKQIDLTEQIREAIRASGLTQTALADKSGITASRVSQFMTSARDMNGGSLDKLARVPEVWAALREKIIA